MATIAPVAVTRPRFVAFVLAIIKFCATTTSGGGALWERQRDSERASLMAHHTEQPHEHGRMMEVQCIEIAALQRNLRSARATAPLLVPMSPMRHHRPKPAAPKPLPPPGYVPETSSRDD